MPAFSMIKADSIQIKKESVTVIIVNFNGGGLLAECLAHLVAQSYAPNQILLMDNGSSDDSVEAVQEVEGVTVRKLGVNLGFAAANNQAISECETEFVALLNPDAFPEPDWLENLLKAASDNPQVSAFGSLQFDASNSEYLDGTGDAYHISGFAWREKYGCKIQNSDLNPREIFSPCAAAALYRKEAVKEVGGFDEDFFCYMEDVDLGFRLRLAGHSAMYVPDAVVHHVGSASTGGQHSDFSVYYGHRNLVWTYIKNMPGILFWVLLPAHVLMNISAIILLTIRGQGRIILKAKWDSIKGIPHAWHKRREIQARRVASTQDIWRVLDKHLLPARWIRAKQRNVQTS